MKILLLAPVHAESEFINQKEELPFLKTQAQQGWYDALKELKHNVRVFRYTDSFLIPNNFRIAVGSFLKFIPPIWRARFSRYANKTNLYFAENIYKNRKLKRAAEEFAPELLIVSGGLSGVGPETLIRLKNKIKFEAILLSGVNPTYGASGYDKKLVSSGFFDFIFVNDGGYAKNWEKMGAKKVVVLPVSASNPKIHTKYKLTKKESDDYKSDVCFIGNLSIYRQNILENLVNFDLKIWGVLPPGVKLSAVLEKYYFGHATGEKMAKIYNATKIALNIHEKDMRFGGNLKTFEIPACGAFQLTDVVSSNWFRKGEEIVVYSNSKDLKNKTRYYLEHDKKRRLIAEAGYSRTVKDHRYTNRFKEIISIINSR